ncbi:MAG: hypothetical protein RLZZ393_1814 [Pseudomonadota bacterium]
MARRIPGRGNALRTSIAQEAARLMAEQGIHDYGLAKRKAAERFGASASDGSILPGNIEIEAALRERQRLFGGEAHSANLVRLRGVAIRAMTLLTGFEPRLVGPVLLGTATEYDDVQLHVFADSVESVVIFLMDRHVDHEVIQRRLRLQADREPVFVPGVRLELDGQGVEAIVFGHDGIRQSPVSQVDGRPMRRAALPEVRELGDDQRLPISR